jgi:hypothetical protein
MDQEQIWANPVGDFPVASVIDGRSAPHRVGTNLRKSWEHYSRN